MFNFFKSKTQEMVDSERSDSVSKDADAESPGVEEKVGPWIGVDLDGTLAEYGEWRGIHHIGKPIPLMKERVLFWVDRGFRVKIMTARASVPEGPHYVRKWLAKHGFPELEVTNEKDFQMIELWDDRAVRVGVNTGQPIMKLGVSSMPVAPLLPSESGESVN